MLRSSFIYFATVLGSDDRLKEMFANDRKGRFNLEEAASELNLSEEYTAALFKPLSSTFFVRGELYPSQKPRKSRPGSSSNINNSFYTMRKRNAKLDRELLRLEKKRISTEEQNNNLYSENQNKTKQKKNTAATTTTLKNF